MQYKFKSLEYNGLKGRIGELVARSFVRSVLAPKLVKEEFWDHVFLSNNDYKQRVRSRNAKLFNYDRFREDFVANGFSADTKLLSELYAFASFLREDAWTTAAGLIITAIGLLLELISLTLMV